MTELQIHPVAALFPMLTDDELADMAADIRERGLIHPVVLDAEGRILDGRNRYAACKLAGVEPRFETYDGDDADGYALKVNVTRRNLSKGQIAMVAASANRISGKYQEEVAGNTGVSQSRIAYANVVLQYAPLLAPSVIAGAKTLNEAYKEARDRKAEDESRDDEARLAEVREAYPDLADMVTEEELTLAAALTEVRERREARQRDIESARRAAGRIVADTQSAVVTIVIGHEQGETGLVTKEMIAALRSAADLLEEKL